jgi:hypothetical protein
MVHYCEISNVLNYPASDKFVHNWLDESSSDMTPWNFQYYVSEQGVY